MGAGPGKGGGEAPCGAGNISERRGHPSFAGATGLLHGALPPGGGAWDSCAPGGCARGVHCVAAEQARLRVVPPNGGRLRLQGGLRGRGPVQGRGQNAPSSATRASKRSLSRTCGKALMRANQQAFFDDDMVVSTEAPEEMKTQAREADQAIVVLSRSFLTKAWPMKELGIFLENGVKVCPVYLELSPDDLGEILQNVDRKTGIKHDMSKGARLERLQRFSSHPRAWKKLLRDVLGECGESPPEEPAAWREDLVRLCSFTGLRRDDLGRDEAGYVKAIVATVAPARLPESVPKLPKHYVGREMVEEVVSQLLKPAPPVSQHRGAFVGMGGAGKAVSTIAAARDPRVRRHYDGGVLWLREVDAPERFEKERLLAKLGLLARDFRELVLRFSGQAYDQEQPGEFQDLDVAYFSTRLARHSLQCLLVVDSVWTKEVLQKLQDSGFHVLVTTRCRVGRGQRVA